MHIQHILKRDGRVAAFDRDKIAQAMAAAGQSTGELDLAGARALTDAVIASLADQPCPGVETIQNRVEEILVQAGHWRTARAFLMREHLGLETSDICKELGITPTHLWVMLHRARMALRQCLSMGWFKT